VADLHDPRTEQVRWFFSLACLLHQQIEESARAVSQNAFESWRDFTRMARSFRSDWCSRHARRRTTGRCSVRGSCRSAQIGLP